MADLQSFVFLFLHLSFPCTSAYGFSEAFRFFIKFS